MKNPYIQLTHILFTEPSDSPDYAIAYSILMHSRNPQIITTNLLAEECSVSKPTIVRFCRSLGYKDFTQFRWSLNLAPDTSMKNYPPVGDLDSFTHSYYSSLKDTVAWMEEHIPKEELIQLAKDIISHKNVYLFGNAQSNDSAYNFMRKLLLQGQQVSVVSNPALQEKTIKHLPPDSLSIVLSVNGDFCITFVEPDCFANKPEKQLVYWLTCNPSCDAVPNVSHTILCCSHGGFTGGNLSIEIVLNLVLQYCWYFRNIH